MPSGHVDDLRIVVLASQEDQGVGRIVAIDELAPGLARTPDFDRILSGQLSAVKAIHESGDDVAVLETLLE